MHKFEQIHLVGEGKEAGVGLSHVVRQGERNGPGCATKARVIPCDLSHGNTLRTERVTD